MQYIIILGAFQALVALALFFAGRSKKPADSLLNWMLVCLFTHLSIKFIIYTLSGNIILKAGFNTFIDLAYGPLLWLYACKIKQDAYQPGKVWYVFLPTLSAAIVYILIVASFIMDPERALILLRIYNDITTWLILLSFLVFPLMALRLAHGLPAFWQMEKKLIIKIAIAFIALSALWLAGVLMEWFHISTAVILATPFRIITYTVLLGISILIVHYRSALQNLLKSAQEETESAQPLQVAERSKQMTMQHPTPPDAAHGQTEAGMITPRRTILPQEQQEAIASTLVKIMRTKKIYTDPDLTLEKLAVILRIPRNHVSETLNQYLNKPFYQFVNEFRIGEVVRLMDIFKKQGITPSILSLAFEAGFQSKTTFNQYFKKNTGRTPSEYFKDEAGIPLHASPSNAQNKSGNNKLTVS